MNFSYDLSKVLGKDRLSVFEKNDLPLKNKQIEEIIETMGIASAKAQGLGIPITTLEKIHKAKKDQKLYFCIDHSENKILGILKTGVKNLFYVEKSGLIKELHPICVLDFYTHESVQRTGVGYELFSYMLNNENVSPHLLAYDKPSPKLQSFLKKYFSLQEYVPQPNNFVIYIDFFSKRGSSNVVSERDNNGERILQRSPQKNNKNSSECFNVKTGIDLKAKASEGEREASLSLSPLSISTKPSFASTRNDNPEALSPGMKIFNNRRNPFPSFPSSSPEKESPNESWSSDPPASSRKSYQMNLSNVLSGQSPYVRAETSPSAFASSYKGKETHDINDMAVSKRDKFLFSHSNIKRPF